MKELSKIASQVQASSTMAIDSLAKQMKADGIDVVGFGAGEPDFNTPDEIKAAGIRAIEENNTRYTPASGLPGIKKAVCDRVKADFHVEYEPSQVMVAAGAKHCVYVALRALVNPGDEVIVPAPYWVSYIELVRMMGGVPVVVTAQESAGFKITAQQLRDELAREFMVDYDDAGSIGKRYRREDEIGTPYCITVDFQTVGDDKTPADNCVTVRDRDTMEQVRIPIDQLKDYIAERVAF